MYLHSLHPSHQRLYHQIKHADSEFIREHYCWTLSHGRYWYMGIARSPQYRLAIVMNYPLHLLSISMMPHCE